MKPLVIILLTSTRTPYAIQTISGIRQHLHCGYGTLFYIACDHSNEDHISQVFSQFAEDTVLGYHIDNLGYGAAVNKAVKNVTEWGYDTHLLIEDDWKLCTDWDITPYVELLRNREDIGMVRLGHMPINLDLESMGYNGRMYLDVKKNRQYAFSGNPHLKHTRFIEQYGYYPEGLNPGDTEVAYDGQVRSKNGSKIVWPLMIGDRFLFAHIGQERSY